MDLFRRVVTLRTCPLCIDLAMANGLVQDIAFLALSNERTLTSAFVRTSVSQPSSVLLTGIFLARLSKRASIVVSKGFPSTSAKRGSPSQTLFPVPLGPMSAHCLK